MSEVTKFRVMRLQSRIHLYEIAALVNISPQRLGQLETRRFGTKPEDPERLIKALETIVAQRKSELEKVEDICRQARETIFDYTEGGEEL